MQILVKMLRHFQKRLVVTERHTVLSFTVLETGVKILQQ